jgi:TonB-linked SusC/RagA family outer membrane protein
MNRVLKCRRFLILLFASFFIVVSEAAAQSEVTGIVRSAADNQALLGVTVQVKGSSNSTATDAKGHYVLRNVSSSDSLLFTYVGFATESVLAGNRREINISLQLEASSLDQVVVVGYGTQKKSDLTGAISQIDGKAFENQPMTQITDMLTGTLAGVNINQGTSASGGNSFMEIRGRTSLTASNAPMIVVDGSIFNGSIEEINPIDVNTIDVLKDASAAAIYGARASNGVILITTKKGGRNKSKPTINFTTNIGLTEAARDQRAYNGEEYIQYRTDVLKSWGTGMPNYYFDSPDKLPEGITIDQWRNLSANPTADNTIEWLNRLRFFPTEIDNYMAGKTVDWYSLVMPKGLRQSYDISISGGSDKFSYYWSGGYVNNEGIIRGDKYSTVRTRLNVDFKVADWINIGLNSQLSSRDNSVAPASLSQMYEVSPYGSLYDTTTGYLKWYPHDYQVAENHLLNTYYQERSNKTSSLFASLYANIKLPLGIEYKLSYQPNNQFGYNYNFWPSATTLTGGVSHRNGYGTRQETRSKDWILDNILHWKRQVGIHNIDVTLLYSGEEHLSWRTNISNVDFAPNQNLGYNALQFGNTPTLTNNDTRTTGDAVMARLNYSLFNKYLVTLSTRRDGYSAFGQKNPRASFPAAAFAWKISDEKFFKANWIDQMKLRLSWGVNGNRDIGAYSSLAQVSPNIYYDGSNTVVGVYNSSLANADLAWERTAAFNMGLNFGLLHNRINVDFNYYNMKTTNLLMNRILPAITGFNNITTNLGEVDNHGFEFTVTSNNMKTPKFNWNTNFVFSLNRNKIKHLFGDYEEVIENGKTIKREVPDYSNHWFPNQAIDIVWDYNVTGIWQLNEAVDAAVYNMIPGNFKAEDVNKDGKYQALDDKKFIGYTQPRYRLGLRNDFTFFNSLSLTVFIRAELKKISYFPNAFHVDDAVLDRLSLLPPPDYWTPDNPINDYPSLLNNLSSYGGGLGYYRPSSFVRIQDLILSYVIPQKVAQRVNLNSLRVFGSVRNLYTFTKWPGWDPESLNSPMPRTYTLGLSFSL